MMGSSQSIPTVDEGKLKHKPLSPDGGRSVLWANSQGGMYHACGCEDKCGTFIHDIPTGSIACRIMTSAERRFIEIEPDENQVFHLTHEALKVPVGWVFRVNDVVLIVDGVDASDTLGDVLAWVEMTGGTGRVIGSDVDTLLSVTGAITMMSEPSLIDDRIKLAMSVPVGRPPTNTNTNVCVMFALKPGKTVNAKLQVSVYTAPTRSIKRDIDSLWPCQRVFRGRVDQESVDVPLHLPTSGLLQAIVVALPFQTVHVRDVALLIDGHEMVCAPGTIARMVFATRYGPVPNRPGWTYLCLPLSMDFVKENGCLGLCGELDLSSPVVKRGTLAVSVRFKKTCPGGDDKEALVQACMLV